MNLHREAACCLRNIASSNTGIKATFQTKKNENGRAAEKAEQPQLLNGPEYLNGPQYQEVKPVEA